MRLSKSSLAMLLAVILICFLVELIAGWLTQQTVHTWYPQLQKPSWTPPDLLFAPVWTLLYLLMAIAVWLIWKTTSPSSKTAAYLFFWGQLLVNLIWSGLFFALRNPLLAMFDIALLWVLIICTIRSFYLINPRAAYLLVPYLLWVTYAASLNGAIWYLNR